MIKKAKDVKKKATKKSKTYTYPENTKCIIDRYEKKNGIWSLTQHYTGTMPTAMTRVNLGSVQTRRRNGELEVIDYVQGTKIVYRPIPRSKR